MRFGVFKSELDRFVARFVEASGHCDFPPATIGNAFDALRAWAKGMYTYEAATELLLRAFNGRYADARQPWIRTDDDSGKPWIDFESIPEYLDMLERRGAAVNVGVFAGHSALRTYVMGADATRRAATPDEVGAMRKLLLEAMAAGAIGFSTSV